MARVLIVDDEKGIRTTLAEFLTAAGHAVACAGDAREALDTLASARFDVVVSDILMPGADGVRLLQSVRALQPDARVVLMTGAPSADTAADALRGGAFDYLQKPIRKGAIVDVVERAIEDLGRDRAVTEAAERDRRSKAELERLLQMRTSELAGLYTATRDITGSLDLTKILAALFAAVSRVAPAHDVVVSSFDPETRLIRCVGAYGLLGIRDVGAFPTTPLETDGQGTQSRVIRTGSPLLLNDCEQHWRAAQTSFFVDEEGNLSEGVAEDPDRTQSAMLVPLLADGEVTGVVQVFSSKRDAFTDAHLRFLGALSAHVATALANAQLFTRATAEIEERRRTEEALRASQEEAKRYAQRLENLRTLERAILAARSVVEIASEATSRALALLACDRAAVVLLDDDSGTVTYQAAAGIGADVVAAGTRITYDAYAMSRINELLEHQTMMTPDLRSLTDPSRVESTLAELGLRSSIGVPAVADGRLLGVLHLVSTQAGFFDEDRLAEAREVADQLAIAIREARWREEHERHAVELEKRVRSRTSELEAANKELDSFAYSVTHDLRAPLRAIDGFSKIVDDDYADLLPPEGRRQLGQVRQQAHKMSRLIDDLLRFSRLSRQPLSRERICVADLVRSVWAELAVAQEPRALRVAIGALPDCDGDPGLIRQVFVNLLSNALKYTLRCGEAVVSIHGETAGDGVIYSVSDNGAGFDMRYADKLFGVFQRLHTETEFEGTGVGLAVVQRIVLRHGGRVWAQAEVDRGATFSFRLPS